MGFGGRKFESSYTAFQTQLRSKDGRSPRKEEKQIRRAKYCPAHSGFELATGGEQTRAKESGSWRVAFDLPLITLHFSRQ
jgi:hypothetical protein